MDWVEVSMFGYREAARSFKKPGDFSSILKTINISPDRFEEVRKEVIKKDNVGLKITAQTSGVPELYEPIITYLTWVVLHDAPKSGKELKYPTNEEYDFFHDTLALGKVEDLKKLVFNDNVPRNQLAQYVQKFMSSKKSDNHLTEEELKVLNSQKEVVDAGGGMSWICLVDGSGKVLGGSPILTKILGHCGNGDGLPGDRMYLLKKKVLGLVPVFKATVIVNGEGFIRESKSSFNKKLDISKYGGAFLKFLEQPFVKGFSDEGAYMADYNLHMSDFFGSAYDAQAKSLIAKKPTLMENDFDKSIAKYKDSVNENPATKKEKLIDLIHNKKINLVQARALNDGVFPFSEEELVSFIKDKKVSIEDIASSDNGLFTVEVQKALANSNENISYMLYMLATLDRSKISKDVLINSIKNLADFSVSNYTGGVGGEASIKLRDYLLKTDNKDLLDVIVKNLSNLRLFSDKTVMDIFRSNPEVFSKEIKNDIRVLSFVGSEARMGIFRKIPDSFSEWVKNYSKSVLLFPEEDRMEIFREMPNDFSEMFKKDSESIKNFPKEDRMEIFRKIPNAFSGGFEYSPHLLEEFPKKDRIDIFRRIPGSFSKVFKNKHMYLVYFPEEDRMEIFRKIPNAFSEIFRYDLGGLIGQSVAEELLKLFPEKFRDEIKQTLEKLKNQNTEKTGTAEISLSCALDKVADTLEHKGFIKEAYNIDLISNYLDKNTFR